MNWDWARLGRALADARGVRTQAQVAQQLDVAKSTIQNIEAGTAYKKISPTIRAYARLVGWTKDSPEKVLAGGDPEPEGTDATPPAAPAAARLDTADLSLRVQRALSEGPLLDSQVMEVETPGGRVLATIVVRGTPDATPEELDQALQAWRDREVTRGMGEKSDGTSDKS